MKEKRKVALVTGCARRVGRAIALELARSGYDIAIHYRHSREEAESLADEIGQLGRRSAQIQAELTDSNRWAGLIDETVAQLGSLDVLVNNASAFLSEGEDTLDAFEPDRWHDMLATNLVAPVALAHYARPHLECSAAGQIVNLCDILGERPSPQHLSYCASKAALIAMTKGLARELAPRVRVNGVAPGIAIFPQSTPSETRQNLTNRVPLGDVASSQGVAVTVRFLVESSQYITGQIIRVDGGRSLV